MFKTFDGVDIFDGDPFYGVHRHRIELEGPFIASKLSISAHQRAEFFSNKKSATQWMESKRPKNKVIDLNHQYSLVANCSKDSVSIEYREGIWNPIVFTKQMINSIADTLKEFEK